MSDDRREVDLGLEDVNGGYIVYDGQYHSRPCYSVVDTRGNVLGSGYSIEGARRFAGEMRLSVVEISRGEVRRLQNREIDEYYHHDGNHNHDRRYR